MKTNHSGSGGMPKRNIGHVYQLDTNRINAMRKDLHVNQLEVWHKRKVIFLEMSFSAYKEASFGSFRRNEKASGYTWTHINEAWPGIDEFQKSIAEIIFPGGPRNKQEINDVTILLTAKMSFATLVTLDGGSNRQPGGMLGNADRLLSELGIRVITAEHAVDEIRACIRIRDNTARKVSAACGRNLPKWVGKD